MKNYEVIETHKKCILEDVDNCTRRDCFECDYLVDDDELIEALDKAVKVLKAVDC